MSDYDKVKAISVRVSKNDLADLELIRQHMLKARGFSYYNPKRSDAIWMAVKDYKKAHDLHRDDEHI